MIKFTDLIEEVEILEEAFAASSDRIIDSIENKRIITIYYMGDKENKPGWRQIEPYAYGTGQNKSGTVEYVRAWQLGGPSVSAQKKGKLYRPMPGWRFFRADRIKNWNVSSNKTFDKPRPNFNFNGDKLMTKVIAIADFTPGETEPPTPIIPKPVKPGPEKPSEKPSDQPKPGGTPTKMPKAIVGTSPLKKALQSVWNAFPDKFVDLVKKAVSKVKSKVGGSKSTQYSKSRGDDSNLNESKGYTLIDAINEVLQEELVYRKRFPEPLDNDNKINVIKEAEIVSAINEAIRIF
jgi:hypothetical protein